MKFLTALYACRVPLVLLLVCVSTVRTIKGKAFLQYTMVVDATITQIKSVPRSSTRIRWCTAMRVKAHTVQQQEYSILVPRRLQYRQGDVVHVLVDPTARHLPVLSNHIQRPSLIYVMYGAMVVCALSSIYIVSTQLT